jgi:hypothetical protein
MVTGFGSDELNEDGSGVERIEGHCVSRCDCLAQRAAWWVADVVDPAVRTIVAGEVHCDHLGKRGPVHGGIRTHTRWTPGTIAVKSTRCAWAVPTLAALDQHGSVLGLALCSVNDVMSPDPGEHVGDRDLSRGAPADVGFRLRIRARRPVTGAGSPVIGS